MSLVLTADVGGTNARFQLWRTAGSGAAQLVFRAVYRPSLFASLPAVIQRFLDDCAASQATVAATPAFSCLAVCGPAWDCGRFNESNNVAAWCPPGRAVSFHDAREFEARLALPAHSLRFMNDFEAIGYCIAAHLDPRASPSAKPEPAPRILHAGRGGNEAIDVAASPAACIGAGTGLGACLIVASGPAAAPSFTVLASEAGMTESVCPRDETEWRLLQFLRARNADATDSYVEIERIVSGPGLVAVAEFLGSEAASKAAAAATMAGAAATTDVTDTPYLGDEAASERLRSACDEDKAAVVAALAQEGNTVCLRAVDTFLHFYGRALGSAAISFLPTEAGLFIAGGILPKLAWRLPCLSASAGAAASASGAATDPLIDGYLRQGPKMSALVARTPLLLVEDGDAGVKGCLFVAMQMSNRAASV
jgi:glucokinase